MSVRTISVPSLLSAAPVVALLAQGACGGGTFNQGSDDFDEADADTDTDADGDADADGDGDTDTDSDTDTDTDPGFCTNTFFPVHESGWRKDYRVTYKGETGSGIEEAVGMITLPNGQDGWEYRETMATTGMTYDLNMQVGCDTESADEGMFLYGYDGTMVMVVFDILPMNIGVQAQLQPYRKFLPPEYAVGSTGNWSYSYTNNVSYTMDTGGGGGQPTAGSVSAQGTFSEAGFSQLQIGTGETVTAHKVINQFQTSGNQMGAPIPASGYIEQWFAAGLGLVKENTYDNADPSTPLITKELVSYSGLSPE